MIYWLTIIYALVLLFCSIKGLPYSFSMAVILTIFEPQLMFIVRKLVDGRKTKLVIWLSTIFCMFLWFVVIIWSPLESKERYMLVVGVTIAMLIRGAILRAILWK